MIIGILDDEIEWGRKIEKHLHDYFILTDNKDYEIICFTNNEELQKKIDIIELLFLDVELENGKSGFDIAEELYRKEFKGKVCFLTSHIEFARLGYKVNAYRFIDKLFMNEINEAVGSYITEIAASEYIECKDKHGIKDVINVGDTVYIEPRERKLAYIQKNGEIYYKDGNLKRVAQEYERLWFVQVHKSFLINMRYIKSYDSRHIEMENGDLIPIGRGYTEDFDKKCFDWKWHRK